MEKAYDLKALGQMLKDGGLPIAEEALEQGAGVAYVSLKKWLQESAPLSDMKLDDVVAPFLDKLDPIVLPMIGNIHKEVV